MTVRHHQSHPHATHARVPRNVQPPCGTPGGLRDASFDQHPRLRTRTMSNTIMNYRDAALSDAKDTVEYFADEIVDQLMDGKASDGSAERLLPWR